ncbi:M20/M25/M40 family metallo-hydrolase [Paracidobacterium acidisoli]|uniref:M20/M25/M40 family metallo-hydrolase n=1 Tax=Paracidobacterium acidisoli TaxID=2303751 RepID=A0A372ISQ5_9BACT|nr:M20/M25/M40 family metallo-hydrolase [Paracidobacterium acidisoli]MBT9330745.1 M20/M25/M40 family metallo-hydrolase [Paracidobacterium acidisoli]
MSAAPTSAYARIANLASDRRVHQAFQWMHLHERQIMQWQAGLVEVPAPPFGERPRAEWLCDRFRDLGLRKVLIDEEGNAIGELPGSDAPVSAAPRPCLLLSAHIDTIFPAGTPIDPVLDGTRLTAPGACDNGAGIAAMLAIAAALRHAHVELPCDLVFLGNVGEEGEGDLRGMRHIYRHAPWRDRIAAHIVLDGAGHEIAVTHALGSQRFLVTLCGPGGHSWTDAGRPNPIVVLSQAIARLGSLALSGSPRTTLNVGTIEGGTSVNAIPEQASARFDLRSTDPEQLMCLEVELHRAVEDAVLDARHAFAAALKDGHARGPGDLKFSIARIGNRPAGRLPSASPLFETLRAVDRHLSIRTEPRVASTDANIPLSLGVPAFSLGSGGEGGGIHTRAEWYDARGRELALRRILLLLLALSHQQTHSSGTLAAI